ncbi:hypothetical protein O1611_g968 [Lasiodiplodia mahajangana]|uniref:Uncharacterized protein n=1 Tax=Lasiodiplodia mahajangana TaxID=1108764 RepID=A0ACC2JYP2_9PEZI|nr:hypothetical protein O1611_g968 [Lasiodiplodia mahajangana]
MDLDAETAGAMFTPQPSDILIAVMGITGAGKSTFISHCTERGVSIGLRSHTQRIGVYPCKPDIGNNVYLIDTPGFDDTERDDAEVLKEIAAWVGHTYEQKVHLRGILYLHRIIDVRMQGAAVRNLFMFKKLCGHNAIKNIILVTTMWEDVQLNTGKPREEELRTTPNYWGDMVSKGARIARHQNDYKSARSIVNFLLENTAQTTLAIQEEMVDEKKDLSDTSAGRELNSILTQERERFSHRLEELKQHMEEARQQQDRESQEQIRLLQEQREAEIKKLLLQQESIKISFEKLHEERFAKLEQLLATQKSQMEADRLEIADLRKKLANASIGTNLNINRNDNERVESRIKSRSLELMNHGDKINAIALSPDGRRIASGSHGSTVKIWDIATGHCLQTLDHDGGPISTLVFSSDSNIIASGSNQSYAFPVVIGFDRQSLAKIWDCGTGNWLQIFSAAFNNVRETGSCLRKFPPDFDKAKYMNATHVVVSPNGRFVAMVTERYYALFCDSETGKELQKIGRQRNVHDVIFSPNSRYMALGSLYSSSFSIWNVESGMHLQTIALRTSLGTSLRTGLSKSRLAFMPDSRFVGTETPFSLAIWDFTGNCLQTFRSHSHTYTIKAAIYQKAFSQDSCRIASALYDSVKIWDGKTGDCLQTLTNLDIRPKIAFSRDNRSLVVATDSTLKIFQT